MTLQTFYSVKANLWLILTFLQLLYFTIRSSSAHGDIDQVKLLIEWQAISFFYLTLKFLQLPSFIIRLSSAHDDTDHFNLFDWVTGLQSGTWHSAFLKVFVKCSCSCYTYSFHRGVSCLYHALCPWWLEWYPISCYQWHAHISSFILANHNPGHEW